MTALSRLWAKSPPRGAKTGELLTHHLSEALHAAFKAALKRRGLSEEIRANKAGCLDNCELGCSVVVYPEGVWYGRVEPGDVDEIVDRHLVGGEPVERLRLYKPSK